MTMSIETLKYKNHYLYMPQFYFFLQFILQHTKTTYFSAQKLFVNGKQSKTVLNLLCQKWKQKMEYIMVCSNTGDTGAKSTEI